MGKLLARGEQTLINLYDGSVIDLGVSNVVISYALSISESVVPTEGWSDAVPDSQGGMLLWARTKTTFTNGTTDTSYLVTPSTSEGQDGKGIKTIGTSYADGSSSTVPPSTGWQAGIPNIPSDHFLWVDTITTYDDNTVTHEYSVLDVKDGIVSILDQYGTSSSSDHAPAKWSDTPLQVTPGWYLWTRSIATYSNRETSAKYVVMYVGQSGERRETVVGTNISYAVDTQEKTPPEAGWQSSVPSVTGNAYLWTRTQKSYQGSPKHDYVYTVDFQKPNGTAVNSVKYTYALSATGDTKPADSKFSVDKPLNITDKYLWTMTTTTFTDGSTSKNYNVTYDGISDIGQVNVTNAPVPPTNPKDGAWWNDTSGVPSVLKYYQGGTWVTQSLEVIDLAVGIATADALFANTITTTNLEATSLNISDVKSSSANITKLTVDDAQLTTATVQQTLKIGDSGSLMQNYTTRGTFKPYTNGGASYSATGTTRLSYAGLTTDANIVFDNKVGGTNTSILQDPLLGMVYPTKGTTKTVHNEYLLDLSTAGMKGLKNKGDSSEINLTNYQTTIVPGRLSIADGKTGVAVDLTLDGVTINSLTSGDSFTNTGTSTFGGRINAGEINSGPIRINGYHTIFTTDNTALFLAGGSQGGGSGVQVTDDLTVTKSLTVNSSITTNSSITASTISTSGSIDSGPIKINGGHTIFTTDKNKLYLLGGSSSGGAGVQVSDDFSVTGNTSTKSLSVSGNIDASGTVDSGPIRMNGYHSIYTTDGTGLYLAGGTSTGGAGVHISDDLYVSGSTSVKALDVSGSIEISSALRRGGTGLYPSYYNNIPGIRIAGTSAGIVFDQKNKFVYAILNGTYYRLTVGLTGSGSWNF